MKPRPSLLRRAWRKLFSASPKPPRRAPAPSKHRPALEPLEGRIAPAILLNPSTLIFKDLDGDIVTVKFSKALFNQSAALNADTANKVFTFTSGANAVTVGTALPANAVAEQLQLIDLTKVITLATGNPANGSGLTISAAPGSLTTGGPLGNGFADIGAIKATNIPLGKVTIDGDLGQIDAGRNGFATGLAGLTVKSLGKRGTATQVTTGASLDSSITGSLTFLSVADDITTAAVNVDGNLGKITVGGSVRGGDADRTGLIQATGNIGAVKIGDDLGDGLFGGDGDNSGAVAASGNILSFTTPGTVKGGLGTSSGQVFATGNLGPVKIDGDLKGGTGGASGVIGGGSLSSITIQGNLLAGAGDSSGLITTPRSIGAVKIGGNIDGTTSTTGAAAGGIHAAAKITSVTVTGALKGGSAIQSGFIDAGGDLGAIVLHDLIGGSAQNAGTITSAGKIASLTVLGNFTGGTARGAGSVFSGTDSQLIGDLGAVKIGGQLLGGTQLNTGLIFSGGKIASLTVGGAATASGIAVKGGVGDWSGAVVSHGVIGTVKITGNLEGAGGDWSGAIVSHDLLLPEVEKAGDLGLVTITGVLKGGGGAHSGQLLAEGNFAGASIGALTGGTGPESGRIEVGSGAIQPGNSGAIKINGDFQKATSGTPGTSSASVAVSGKLASLLVNGNLLNGTIASGVSLGAVTIKGNVSGSQILAGYDLALQAVNPDAKIGAVSVTGAWTASSLAAGVARGSVNGFGTAADAAADGFDDPAIISQIASIVIGGAVTGNAGTGNFGFVAQKIGSFKAAGVVHTFSAATPGEVFAVSSDVTVREIALV